MSKNLSSESLYENANAPAICVYKNSFKNAKNVKGYQLSKDQFSEKLCWKIMCLYNHKWKLSKI